MCVCVCVCAVLVWHCMLRRTCLWFSHLHFAFKGNSLVSTRTGMVPVLLWLVAALGVLIYVSLCVLWCAGCVSTNEGTLLSLSLSVSPPGCGWMTPTYLPPSPLFSRHICTHSTVYTHTCTRALLIAHPEKEKGLVQKVSYPVSTYIPERTCLPYASWVWPKI